MGKALLSSALFTIAVYLGISIRRKYKKRAAFYREYLAFLTFAEERVTASRAPRAEIIRSFPSSSALLSMLTGNGEVPSFLGKNGEAIRAFFDRFGLSDYTNTVSSVQEEKARVSSLCAVAEKEYAGKGAMIQKLCLLGGISAVILVI